MESRATISIEIKGVRLALDLEVSSQAVELLRETQPDQFAAGDIASEILEEAIRESLMAVRDGLLQVHDEVYRNLVSAWGRSVMEAIDTRTID